MDGTITRCRAEAVDPFLLQLREAAESPRMAAVAACAITGALFEAQLGLQVNLLPFQSWAQSCPAFFYNTDSCAGFNAGCVIQGALLEVPLSGKTARYVRFACGAATEFSTANAWSVQITSDHTLAALSSPPLEDAGCLEKVPLL